MTYIGLFMIVVGRRNPKRPPDSQMKCSARRQETSNRLLQKTKKKDNLQPTP